MTSRLSSRQPESQSMDIAIKTKAGLIIVDPTTPIEIQTQILSLKNEISPFQTQGLMRGNKFEILKWVKQCAYKLLILKAKNFCPEILIHVNHIDLLSSLITLNLSFNRINNIQALAFVNCTQLEIIYLDSNQLSSIRALAKCKFSKLKKISADRNPYVDPDEKGHFFGRSSLAKLESLSIVCGHQFKKIQHKESIAKQILKIQSKQLRSVNLNKSLQGTEGKDRFLLARRFMMTQNRFKFVESQRFQQWRMFQV